MHCIAVEVFVACLFDPAYLRHRCAFMENLRCCAKPDAATMHTALLVCMLECFVAGSPKGSGGV